MDEPNNDWIDELATQLTHVLPDFVAEVKGMSRKELQRRVLIQSDYVGLFASSLDAIPEIQCIPGCGVDRCRDHRNIRSVVAALVKHCPVTWEHTYKGQRKNAMDLTQFARVGDTLECQVRSPQPGVIRLQLLTPEACAHANDLLANPASGWKLVPSPR
ncbi:hypothetical protein ACXIVK_27925 [Paraburkholderia caledonica]|jgi:hypothetical protein